MTAQARARSFPDGGHWLDLQAPNGPEALTELEARHWTAQLPEVIRGRLRDAFDRPRVTAMDEAVYFSFWWPLRVSRRDTDQAGDRGGGARRAAARRDPSGDNPRLIGLDSTPVGVLLVKQGMATIHRVPLVPVQAVLAGKDKHRVASPDAALYAILEDVVGDFDRFALRLANLAEQASSMLSRGTGRSFFYYLLDVRQEALRLRHLLGPARAVIELLRAPKFQLVSERWRPYFSDLADRVKQLIDDVEDVRLSLRETMEAHRNIHNERQNNVMQVLTVISAFALPTTLVASIYGMNFRIPEYGWPHGYWYALGLMVAMSMSLFGYLHWKGWFR